MTFHYLYSSLPNRNAKMPVTSALISATTIWLSEIIVMLLLDYYLYRFQHKQPKLRCDMITSLFPTYSFV